MQICAYPQNFAIPFRGLCTPKMVSIYFCMRLPIGSQRGLLLTFKTNIIWYCLYVDPKMTSSATWMDLEMIILNEVSQTEKDKYMILLIFEI